MSAEGRTLEHQPALDGLRAVAVTLVLLFHGGFSWMTGGYVGVSVFFTLSGYLITTLLLVEHERSGTVRLGRFYARRMKRLLPASLLCLGAVTVAAAAGAFDEFPALRRDLLGALFQVANWVKLLGDASYADLTNATLGRVAPLEHYWSLAIEEQFYWLWPLVVLGLFRLRRRGGGRLDPVAGGIAALTAVSVVAAPWIAHVWGADAAYWATPARAGEILVGATLAVALRHRTGSGASLPSGVWWCAVAGLAVVGWAAVSWPSDHGPAYEGWLPMFALASAAVILGLQVSSPVRQLLSLRPVVWVGTVSYGLYLYHWPLFAVLTADRVGTDGTALFAVRLAVTVVAAAVSSWLVELPVRRWNPDWRRPLLAGGVASALLAGVIGVAVVPVRTGAVAAGDEVAAVTLAPIEGSLAPLATVPAASTSSASSASSGSDASTASSPGDTLPGDTLPGDTLPGDTLPDDTPPTDTAPAATAVGADVPVPAVSRPVRIMVVGDSTAQHTASGLAMWAADHPEVARVTDASVAGCGFLRTGTVPTDGDIDWQGQCDELLDDRLPGLLAELRPDVVVLMVTMRDVEDREWPGEGLVTPFDDRYRARLLDDYRAMADRLRDAGVPHIAWVLPPYPIAPFQGEQVKMLDPARYQVQFDVIDQVAAERPDVVRVLDLRAWVEATGHGKDGGWRPDGLHWSDAAGYEVADRYLAGSVVSAAVG
ncbi:MAG: acyltransferase family protein [Acidimicrobiales bacterium]